MDLCSKWPGLGRKYTHFLTVSFISLMYTCFVDVLPNSLTVTKLSSEKDKQLFLLHQHKSIVLYMLVTQYSGQTALTVYSKDCLEMFGQRHVHELTKSPSHHFSFWKQNYKYNSPFVLTDWQVKINNALIIETASDCQHLETSAMIVEWSDWTHFFALTQDKTGHNTPHRILWN